jgi:hypothetical protein
MAGNAPGADVRTRPRWTPRLVRRGVFVVTFLLVQLTTPLMQLAGDGVGRFGWQMYAGVGPTWGFEAVHADGTTTSVDVADFAVRDRAEIDWRPLLRGHVCAAPGVVAVRYHDAALEPHELPCD